MRARAPGTLVVWAGSHFFRVGEIVDVVLLVVGFSLIGVAVFDGAEALYQFSTTATRARTETELDRAARHSQPQSMF